MWRRITAAYDDHLKKLGANPAMVAPATRWVLFGHLTRTQGMAARRYADIIRNFEKFFSEGGAARRAPPTSNPCASRSEDVLQRDLMNGTLDEFEDDARKAKRQYKRLMKVLDRYRDPITGRNFAKDHLDTLCLEESRARRAIPRQHRRRAHRRRQGVRPRREAPQDHGRQGLMSASAIFLAGGQHTRRSPVGRMLWARRCRTQASASAAGARGWKYYGEPAEQHRMVAPQRRHLADGHHRAHADAPWLVPPQAAHRGRLHEAARQRGGAAVTAAEIQEIIRVATIAAVIVIFAFFFIRSIFGGD
jgi:hypothetical protein